MRPKKRGRGGAYLLPNTFTAFNIICGILAVILSSEHLHGHHPAGHPLHSAPAWLILAAMVFDYLDGKVARWVHATSDFGVKIDSLADLLSFGIAPVALVCSTLLHPLPFGLQAVIGGGFIFAGAWRLARFNCESLPDGDQHFSGLPIPAAAAFIASLVLVSEMPGPETVKIFGPALAALPPETAGAWVGIICLLLAWLMVSRIPFSAFKKMNRPNLLLFGGVVIFFLVLFLILPLQNILFLMMLLYVVFGLFQYFLDRVLQMQKRDLSNHPGVQRK